MTATVSEWLAILNLLIVIGGGIAGFFAIRSGMAKAEQEVQARVREALRDENVLLQSKVERLERELVHIRSLMHLLIETLDKHRNIKVEANSDSIIIHDGAQTLIAHLPDS